MPFPSLQGMRRCQLLERSKERVPPPRGDQPKNWRATNPRTGGHQPENWQAALLFNIDGVIKFFGAGLFTEFEVAGETSSRTPSLCRSSLVDFRRYALVVLEVVGRYRHAWQLTAYRGRSWPHDRHVPQASLPRRRSVRVCSWLHDEMLVTGFPPSLRDLW